MGVKDINFAAMPQIAVNVITKPAKFFKTMPKTGGFLEPLIFAIIMGVIAGIIRALIGIFHFTYISERVTECLGFIILYPIFIASGSFIVAAILFVIWWKLMESQENYETSCRCIAYLAALAPIVVMISAIPYVGNIINMAICVYYLVIASKHVHNIPEQKAWLVFGIIGAILVLILIALENEARNMAPTEEEYRKKAEEINRQYLKQIEEYRKQAKRNR